MLCQAQRTGYAVRLNFLSVLPGSNGDEALAEGLHRRHHDLLPLRGSLLARLIQTNNVHKNRGILAVIQPVRFTSLPHRHARLQCLAPTLLAGSTIAKGSTAASKCAHTWAAP